LRAKRPRAAAVIAGSRPSGGSITIEARFCPSITVKRDPESIQKLL